MKRTSVLLLLLVYLGVYGNHLALWQEGERTPKQVLPYRVELYPVADQQALRHGIPITSEVEFMRVLENYFS